MIPIRIYNECTNLLSGENVSDIVKIVLRKKLSQTIFYKNNIEKDIGIRVNPCKMRLKIVTIKYLKDCFANKDKFHKLGH